MATIPFELSESKQTLLKTKGHILTLGGPGSGKTTIALFKANQIIKDDLKFGQRILFLSFARATITRVAQQSKVIVPDTVRKQLEINTYHGFAWNILRSHGYLLNSDSQLKLLPPPEAASRLADTAEDRREAEKIRLFTEEGLLHFDLFAKLSGDLLSKSNSLTGILCNAYPYIILDEFQDTNADEWRFIQELGKKSTLIALADLDQRIFEFRGANPARIGEFIEAYNPTSFDFGTENNRSNGTDIVEFGNDLLTGFNKKKKYKNVLIKEYPIRKGNGLHLEMKTEVLKALDRLGKSENPNWTLAILVPTKKLMLNVSDYLTSRQKISANNLLPEIHHDVALEMAGPSLAAILIAKLLEQGDSDQELHQQLLNNLFDHIRGRVGNGTPNKEQLGLAASIQDFLKSKKTARKGSNKAMIISEAFRIASMCRTIKFSGDPGADWITIRNLLFDSSSETIKQVALDAQYLRLLHKGAILSSGLGNLWRTNGSYEGATQLVRNSLLQDHFSSTVTVKKGIHVMTIHKAKGKEFDEVIVYEGVHRDRIVWADQGTKEYQQSRLLLRVAITRAMRQTTILTPKNNKCPFL